MFHTFQEEDIYLTMIYLEAYYTQLEVDALLEKEKTERIETDYKLNKKIDNLSNETKENFNKKQDKLTQNYNLDIDYINCNRYVSSKDVYVFGDFSFHNKATPENAPRFTKAVRTVQNNIQLPIIKIINDKSTEEKVPTAKSVYEYSKWENIDTNDFVTNIEYKIKNFDINYTYQIYTGSSSSNAGTIMSIPNFNGFIMQATPLFRNQICNIQLSENG